MFSISARRLASAGRHLSTSAPSPSAILAQLGIKSECSGVFDGKSWNANGEWSDAVAPATGEVMARVRMGTVQDLQRCTQAALDARADWAAIPAPRRGEIVRQIGNKFRENIEPLGLLISMEMGKIASEGRGEVQEVVDIADLACGMSRQMPGHVFPSERAKHALIEVWNPIGTIGIITAFNFPCAVYGWNAALSLIAGNTSVWKGSPSTSLVSIATNKLVTDVLQANNVNPAVSTLVQGGADVGAAMAADSRLPLISFTGSTAVGRSVGATVGKRLGKTILELGGNNACIVMDDADLGMALRSCVFGAVGTAGQRCTTLRRLYVHEKVYDNFVPQLVKAYGSVAIGNPLLPGTLMGPLHNSMAVKVFVDTVAAAKAQGGKVLYGGATREQGANLPSKGHFVQPTIIEIDHSAAVVQHEAFVPCLYVMKIKSYEEAVAKNNAVSQGLSSSLFTRDMRNVFRWMGPQGSDCGLVNVNAGTSGAEIGGAFGGEKDTGGGRESGSDSWKQYMRRSTCTINYGNDMPLAQGITFDV